MRRGKDKFSVKLLWCQIAQCQSGTILFSTKTICQQRSIFFLCKGRSANADKGGLQIQFFCCERPVIWWLVISKPHYKSGEATLAAKSLLRFWLKPKTLNLLLKMFKYHISRLNWRKVNSKFSIRHLDWGIPEICRCEAEVNWCLAQCKSAIGRRWHLSKLTTYIETWALYLLRGVDLHEGGGGERYGFYIIIITIVEVAIRIIMGMALGDGSFCMVGHHCRPC